MNTLVILSFSPVNIWISSDPCHPHTSRLRCTSSVLFNRFSSKLGHIGTQELNVYHRRKHSTPIFSPDNSERSFSFNDYLIDAEHTSGWHSVTERCWGRPFLAQGWTLFEIVSLVEPCNQNERLLEIKTSSSQRTPVTLDGLWLSSVLLSYNECDRQRWTWCSEQVGWFWHGCCTPAYELWYEGNGHLLYR